METVAGLVLLAAVIAVLGLLIAGSNTGRNSGFPRSRLGKRRK